MEPLHINGILGNKLDAFIIFRVTTSFDNSAETIPRRYLFQSRSVGYTAADPRQHSQGFRSRRGFFVFPPPTSSIIL
jgi:hypothetical protein